MKKEAVTIAQIAKAANMAPSTVSMALRGNALIHEDTRNRINELARQMGYVPNYTARALANGKSGIIGICEATGHVTAFLHLNSMLSNAFAQNSYRTISYRAIRGENNDYRIESNIRTLISQGCEAVIVITTDYEFPWKFKYDDYTVPLVVCGTKSFDISIDTLSGARRLTEHLLNLGHRKIAFINSVPEANQAKISGYREALQQEEITWNRMIYWNDNPAKEQDTKQLLEVDPPDAIICSNDVIAGYLYLILRERGIRIPEDIAVCGFDGDQFGVFIDPPLTTVRQPIESLADFLCKCALDKISRKVLARTSSPLLLEPQLIIRKSCGNPQTHQDFSWMKENIEFQ